MERDHIAKLKVLAARVALSAILAGSALFGCSSHTVTYRAVEVPAIDSRMEAYPVQPSGDEPEKLDFGAFGHYVQGVLFDQIGEFELAVAYYREALKVYPNSYEIRYSLAKDYQRLYWYGEVLTILQGIEPEDTKVLHLRANCYRANGDIDRARSTYLTIVEMDPDDSPAFRFLATVYRDLAVTDSALWAAENLLRLDPRNYRLSQEVGRLQAHFGRIDDAKETYRQSIRLRGGAENILSYVGLGEIFRVEKQIDSAIATYEEGLEVDSTNMVLNKTLTDIYLRLDSLEIAAAYARRASEAVPLDRFSSRRLGAIYFALDSLRQADSIFTGLVGSGERFALNHWYLGRLALLDDDFPRAIEEFSLLTQMADTTADSWLDLGFAYRRNGQPDSELEVYRTGLEHMRDGASGTKLMFVLGASYERYGRSDEAVETFEKIVANNPDHHQSKNFLGYVLVERSERLDYARVLIGEAVSAMPENGAYIDSYGWLFYKLGQYDSAVVYLEQAVSLDNDPVILDHLGDAYEAVGRTEEARKWWQKALEMKPEDVAIKEKLGH